MMTTDRYEMELRAKEQAAVLQKMADQRGERVIPTNWPGWNPEPTASDPMAQRLPALPNIAKGIRQSEARAAEFTKRIDAIADSLFGEQPRACSVGDECDVRAAGAVGLLEEATDALDRQMQALSSAIDRLIGLA